MAVLAANVLPSPGPAGEVQAGIVVTAPREGALLDQATVHLSGSEEGGTSSTLSVSLNGVKLPPVSLREGTFTATLSLKPGKNKIILETSTARKDIEYEFRNGADGAVYRFHAGYGEGECSECHTASMPGPGGGSDLCYSCHDRKDTAKFLHGPVGAGQCIVCHDPHGSSYEAFLTAQSRSLCVGCHDQSSSSKHLKDNSGRGCEECHNPHGSQKEFLLN